MMKRLFTFFLCFVFSLLVIWGGIFGTDYVRCRQMKKPVFAMGVSDTLADDGGSGTYRGPGYEIEIDGHLSAEYGFQVDKMEMSLLGMTVYAVIACY